MNNNQQLQKTLGFGATLSIVIGSVIGSGVFFKPQVVFGATVAPGLGVLAWVIGGILTIAAGLTTAEIGAAIPKTGGIVVYLEEIYGKKTGFLSGWMLSVLYYPGLIAALAVIFGTQVANILGCSQSLTVPFAILGIALLTFLNTLGSKTGGAIQVVSTVCKLIPLVLLIIVGLIKGEGSVSTSLLPIVDKSVSTPSALGTALLAVLFAYEGWLNVANIAGEMKNPSKDLPKSIIFGISGVMLVYVLINVAYLWVLPADVLASSATPASEVAKILFGNSGGKLIDIGILISVFGTLNALLLTGPRSLFKIAEEGKFPMYKTFSKLNKGSVPGNATWFIALLSSIFALTGSFNLLTAVVVFVIWLFSIFTFIGVMILRKTQPELERPYKVPMYPFIPIVATLGGGYVVVSTLFNSPLYSLLGLGITALGLPIYWYMSKKSSTNI